MQTQCPACQTTFKVTPAQLEVRGGMVRCGICSAVFHAQPLAPKETPKPKPAESEAAAPPATPEKRRQSGRGRRRSGRRRADKLRFIDEKLAQESGIPTVSKQPLLSRSRWALSSLLWGAGSLVLVLLLGAQFVYFYRNELATVAEWRPVLAELCEIVGCELRPYRDISRIELIQTSIAPHGQFDNVLRLRAALVNRAPLHQAYPWMEVTLTGNDGGIVARRTFAPIQYSETPLEGALTPNVVASALLDITNPDGKAVGYEIRLVTP